MASECELAANFAESVDLERAEPEGEVYTGVVDQKEFGNLERGLKSRHVQFIALGGMIGTGLFLGTGPALQIAGPLSVFLAYLITGSVVFSMIQGLGEITTHLPIPGGLTVYAYRYAEPAMGFAMGWNYVFSSGIILCAEISAASMVISYWDDTIHVGVWIIMILAIVASLNIFVVSSYGESEFIFASFKILTIIALLVIALVLDLGGGPKRDRLGFRYWKHPGAMKEYMLDGHAGRLCGFLKSFVNAVFSFLGAEVIAVAACETKAPRRNIPKAVRRTFWRIVCFYVFGALAIGLIIPYDDPTLAEAISSGKPGAAASPWVVALENAGISGLPHIVNAVILTSAWSCANAFCYAGSRNLYALAISGAAPKVFAKCTSRGIPIYSVMALVAFGLFSFSNAVKSSAEVFNWFVTATTASGLWNWVTLSVAYIRWRRGLKVRGISIAGLPFKGWCQPFAAWYTLVMCLFFIAINGFEVFFKGHWSTSKFFASYAGVLMYGVPYAVYKYLWGGGLVKYDVMDFTTGKAEVDRLEVIETARWREKQKQPKSIVLRLWGVLV
ncbi:amino acid permease/ SLC12A domain-containing protein [Geopyxis carbonaria]|nr:amino acid permease/ SLC12A domain-containing protein [Geopyxis carbonaria]